jgi:hypothetical protein
VEITCRVYKPRQPRESPLYRLVEQHLEDLLRVWILARRLDRHAISRELAQKLLAWRHPGFSAHVGEPLEPEEILRVAEHGEGWGVLADRE